MSNRNDIRTVIGSWRGPANFFVPAEYCDALTDAVWLALPELHRPHQRHVCTCSGLIEGQAFPFAGCPIHGSLAPAEEDVKPGAGSLSVQRPNESRPDTPPEGAPSGETCGSPATYRLGSPSPAWCDAHGPRPSAPPEEVAALIETLRRDAHIPGVAPATAIQAADALAALRAPVPVEVQYRARAADGYVYGESRTTPEAAVAAYEEALDRVTLEQADETPVVEERAVTPWVLFCPTREEGQ